MGEISMSDTSPTLEKGSVQPNWRQAVAGFQHADHRRSAWQLANTLIPYLALWVLMVLSLRVSYWLTLALSDPHGRLTDAHLHYLSRLLPRFLL